MGQAGVEVTATVELLTEVVVATGQAGKVLAELEDALEAEATEALVGFEDATSVEVLVGATIELATVELALT